MNVASKERARLLGKSFGAASGQLRKALLFQLAGRLDLLDCHRCGVEIVDIADFSVEHKTAWQSAPDPKASFFDLDNVAFSHLGCNSSAAHKPNKKYSSTSERKAAQWKRYYERKAEQVLSRKRDRYHKTNQV